MQCSKILSVALILSMVPVAAHACCDLDVWVTDTQCGPAEQMTASVMTDGDLFYEEVLSFHFTFYYCDDYLMVEDIRAGTITSGVTGDLEVLQGPGVIEVYWTGCEFLTGPGSFIDVDLAPRETVVCNDNCLISVSPCAEFYVNEDCLCENPLPGNWRAGDIVSACVFTGYCFDYPCCPVPGVEVDLTSTCEICDQGYTGPNGWLCFPVCTQCCYTIDPYKEDADCELLLTLNMEDAAVIMGNVIHGCELTECQEYVADVSRNGEVTEYDAALLGNWLCACLTGTPMPSDNHVGEWELEAIDPLEFCVEESCVERHLKAHLMGDVDGNYCGDLRDDNPIPVQVITEDTPWLVGTPMRVLCQGGPDELSSGALQFTYDDDRVLCTDALRAFDLPTGVEDLWIVNDNNGVLTVLFAFSQPIPMPEHLIDIQFDWHGGGGTVPVETTELMLNADPLDPEFNNGRLLLPADAISEHFDKSSGPISGFRLSRSILSENASATINFSLAAANAVDLAIFDVSGRTVRTLSSQTLGAGNHSFTWNGRTAEGVAAEAGVYFARLRGGGHELQQRVLLVR